MLESYIAAVDGLNERVGRAVAWLTLGCVLVTFAVVVLRYFFGTGEVWMTDLYVWLHAAVFMLGAGYTFKWGGHVRVDIVYGRLSPRRKAWIDIVGTLVFLFPWLFVIADHSYDWILNSWAIRERSVNENGMQGLFLLKTAIWLFVVLVGLQGSALVARSILVLRGREEFLARSESH